jgi:hypothetical protein
MSSKGNKHSAGSFLAKNPASNKKTKTQSSLAQTFGNNAFPPSSLRKTHNGKRILLRAKTIYNGTVSDGEEVHLFQYSVQNVNNDCETAIIDLMRNVFLRTETSSKTTQILLMTIQPLKIIKLKC